MHSLFPTMNLNIGSIILQNYDLECQSTSVSFHYLCSLLKGVEIKSYNLVEDYVSIQDQFFFKHIDESICLGICTITNKGTLSIFRLKF
jgi:hypothetical protein